MSKSKKNTVEPLRIVKNYGADVARLFMLSDTPPQRDLDWSESGIDGAWRYVNRLWRLVASSDVSSANSQISHDDSILKLIVFNLIMHSLLALQGLLFSPTLVTLYLVLFQ